MSSAAEEPDRLQALTAELTAAAERLRAHEGEAEEASALAAECARLAGEAAAELEARARAAGA